MMNFSGNLPPAAPSARPGPPADERIDLDDAGAAEARCQHFGITRVQLEEAVQAVGDEPAAVREHLLNQGASAGAG